jgi:hypothetical protein
MQRRRGSRWRKPSNSKKKGKAISGEWAKIKLLEEGAGEETLKQAINMYRYLFDFIMIIDGRRWRRL